MLEIADSLEVEVSDYKNLYVGEGKKYATEAEALKGLHHANEHISKLEQENADIRNKLMAEEATKNAKLDAIIKKFEAGEKPKEESKASSASSNLGSDAIKQLVADALKAERDALERESRMQQDAARKVEHQTKLVQALESTYGSKEAGIKALKAAADKIKNDNIPVELQLIQILCPKDETTTNVNIESNKALDITATNAKLADAFDFVKRYTGHSLSELQAAGNKGK